MENDRNKDGGIRALAYWYFYLCFCACVIFCCLFPICMGPSSLIASLIVFTHTRILFFVMLFRVMFHCFGFVRLWCYLYAADIVETYGT